MFGDWRTPPSLNIRQMCIRDRRYVGKNISINLGRADAMLTEQEQVKTEHFKPTERIKLYVVEVKNTPKGPKILDVYKRQDSSWLRCGKPQKRTYQRKPGGSSDRNRGSYGGGCSHDRQ